MVVATLVACSTGEVAEPAASGPPPSTGDGTVSTTTYHEHVVLHEVVGENPEIAALRELTRDLPPDAGYPQRVRQGELVARAVEAKRAHDEDLLLDLVLPHAVSYAVHDRSGVDHLLYVALLVDDGRRETFEEAMESVAEGMHERARFQLRGPLPPYDFVDGDWWV